MGQILGLLSKGIVFKFLAVAFSVAVVTLIVQLSGEYQVRALNVRTEIKATPAGIVKIIDRTGSAPAGITDPDDDSPTNDDTYFTPTFIEATQQGEPTSDSDNGSTSSTSPSDNKTNQSKSPSKPKAGGGGGGGGTAKPKVVNPKSSRPTVLTINTPIVFGRVFPGEEMSDNFSISLSSENIIGADYVEYHITSELTDDGGAPSPWLDLTPYLTIELEGDEHDGDDDTDTMASATLNGTAGDLSDTWWVTFKVPDDPTTGEYWSVITIHVDYPTVKPTP